MKFQMGHLVPIRLHLETVQPKCQFRMKVIFLMSLALILGMFIVDSDAAGVAANLEEASLHWTLTFSLISLFFPQFLSYTRIA